MTAKRNTRKAGDDPVLDALEALERAVEENMVRSRLLLDRIRYVRRERKAGHSYRQIVESEERPGIVELASANLEALVTAGSTLRRVKAYALHNEGMTMDEIAEHYGVTRQRVSALLKNWPR